MLAAAAQSRGDIELFAGNPLEAKEHLVTALQKWREVKLPYETAQCQVQIGRHMRRREIMMPPSSSFNRPDPL